MITYKVSHPTKVIEGKIDLASSKSESNRALIINALSGSKNELQRLANARDTETMQRLLKSDSDVLDVLDAGTTMRFLTAYTAISGHKKIITGSSRMKERPIKLLVDALRDLGASIEYLENEGFPPIQINGFDSKKGSNKIEIRGDVSSQYISALLLVSPSLPNGIELTLTGKIGSKPYIQMTLNQMTHFGAKYSWVGNVITVFPTSYHQNQYTIESDWSGASYWYSMVALAKEAKVELLGLREISSQGDSVLVQLMEKLGVKSTFTKDGVVLEKTLHQDSIEWDFTHCPDIAQTISVICAAKGISAYLTGLESLRIKETDRIEAIKNELAKFGVPVEIEGDEAIKISNPKFVMQSAVAVATYKDHRMAMSYAPLALLNNVKIENPEVVIKSYPDFWRDLTDVGFEIEEV
jgi:3-phosphoshikimate 1-carboxyvinyltransferase